MKTFLILLFATISINSYATVFHWDILEQKLSDKTQSTSKDDYSFKSPYTTENSAWSCSIATPQGFKDSRGNYQEDATIFCKLKSDSNIKVSSFGGCVKIKNIKGKQHVGNGPSLSVYSKEGETRIYADCRD